MPERQSASAVARPIRIRAGALRWILALITLGCMVLLAACGGDSDSGPVEVKWDRAACERCRMLLSDRRHAAEVRFSTPGGKSKVLFFDDIGCTLIWLEAQSREVQESPSTEVWVTDWRTGHWIDARVATYVTGQVTPMEYGLGAQIEPAQAGLDFARAKDHIFEVERRFNVHGAHREPGSMGDSAH